MVVLAKKEKRIRTSTITESQIKSNYLYTLKASKRQYKMKQYIIVYILRASEHVFVTWNNLLFIVSAFWSVFELTIICENKIYSILISMLPDQYCLDTLDSKKRVSEGDRERELYVCLSVFGLKCINISNIDFPQFSSSFPSLMQCIIKIEKPLHH